jgi:uridylate kinase
MMDCKYKRILLKISGEALAGGSGHGINEETVMKISQIIKNVMIWVLK